MKADEAVCSGLRRVGAVCLAVLAAGFLAGCSETKTVAIRYTLAPDHPECLQGGREGIRVCVVKVDVDWRVNRTGSGDPTIPLGESMMWQITYTDGSGKVEKGQVTIGRVTADQSSRNGELWENLCRSEILGLIQAQAAAAGKKVELVDRDHLDKMLQEKDLKLADIVQGNKVTDKVKLLDIDLMIVAAIDGQTTVEFGKERDLGASIVNHLPYVPGSFETEKTRVRRTMTVGGNFQAIDMRNAKIWLTHPISGQVVLDKKPTPFVGDSGELALIPQEQHIKEILDTEVRKFVGRMLPMPAEELVEVESSSGSDCMAGVKLLDIDNEAALVRLRAAVARDPHDWRARYGAGVACELLGRFAEAADHYQRAAAEAKKDMKPICKAAHERAKARAARSQTPLTSRPAAQP